MGIYSIIIIAIGLAMDSFAVCISRSVCHTRFIPFRSFKIAIVFGLFQGAMPLIGYGLGLGFAHWIKNFDHWFAFLILGIIGLKMIYDSLRSEEDECLCLDGTESSDLINWKSIVLMALATSIDALATGLIFVPYPQTIVSAVVIIAIVSLLFTFVGMYIGTYFGKKFRFDMTIVGGVMLIGIGTKILIEHTM